jgi:MFS transporter, DHA2 family, methylenomycin A resistance protein
MIFVLALYLQQVLQYSPLAAGVAFLPLPFVLGIANVAAGPTGHRFGLRIPMAMGLLIGAVGYCPLAQLGPASRYITLLPGLMVIPLGVGLSVPLMTSALLASVPKERSGVASGVLNTVRQAGGGIGVALFGALMAGHSVGGLRLALLLSAAVFICAAAFAVTWVGRRSAVQSSSEQLVQAQSAAKC